MSWRNMRIDDIEVVGTVEKNPKGQNGQVGWRNYVVDIVYVLADGRRIESTEGSRLKRDVLEGVERDRQRAKAGTLTASLNEDGEFIGTRWAAWIGPREAEPTPRFDDEGYALLSDGSYA